MHRLAIALAGGARAVAPAAGASLAGPVKTPHVEAELVAEHTALVPGQTTTVALRLKMEDGWHTYWQNPGDSGLPTTLAWKLPPGYTAGDIEWPAPRALPAGPLVNYGYEGEVLHLVRRHGARAMRRPASRCTLGAQADWLVCRETCIPEGADLDAGAAGRRRRRPVSASGARRSPPRAPRCPRPLPGWLAAARGDGAEGRADADGPGRRAGAGGRCISSRTTERRIEPSGAADVRRATTTARYVLTLPVANQLAPRVQRASQGVLDGGQRIARAARTCRRPSTIDVPLTGAVVAGPKPALGAGAGAQRARRRVPAGDGHVAVRRARVRVRSAACC